MCMSTTGFGPQALHSTSRSMHLSSHSPNTAYPPTSDTDTDMTGYQPSGNAYLQQPRRPVPRFDMNLKDLFSDEETDKRSFSRISNQVGSMRPPPPREVKQEHTQPFTADLKISPQMRTHHLQQQQSHSFQQHQGLPSPQHPYTPASTSASLSPLTSQTTNLPSPYQAPPHLTNQLPYNAFAQNIASTYPDFGTFNDLDFLDSFPIQGASAANVTDAAGPLQDLGFGMGFGDGAHDWSDGNGLDLFDGFFFGGGPGNG